MAIVAPGGEGDAPFVAAVGVGDEGVIVAVPSIRPKAIVRVAAFHFAPMRPSLPKSAIVTGARQASLPAAAASRLAAMRRRPRPTTSAIAAPRPRASRVILEVEPMLERGQLAAHRLDPLALQLGDDDAFASRPRQATISPHGSTTRLWPNVRRPFSCVPPCAAATT